MATATATATAARTLLRIGHINIRSLTSKIDDIMILLGNHQIDLLCLSETWLKSQVLDKFLPFPGYRILRRDREGRRGGGVAILHREEMQVKQLSMSGEGPLETLWASATWRGGRPTTVGVIYRPPDSPVAASLEHLEDQLREAAGAGRPVFALGDLNFNVLDSNSPDTRRYLQVIRELNMIQLIDGPTHLEPTPSALDHIITNQTEPAPEVTILPDVISDHQPIMASAQLGRVRRPVQWRTIRSWRRADWSAICLDLLQSDWDGIDGATDVDQCVSHFMSVWNAVMDRHCPPRRVRIARPHCPWIADDPALRALLSERDNARDTWLCLRTPEARAHFVRLRNQVKSRLIAARRQFLCGEMTSGDRRGFWPTFKRFATATATPAGALAASPEETVAAADQINRHFADVGPRIAADLREAVTAGRENPRPPTVCAAGFELRPATLPELSRCIQRMSASRAVGLDEVPLFAVRECFAVVGPHLLRLVNLSLKMKVFPRQWKTACIVPIPKTGDPQIPSNNRPISLLSALSKILEKVVCSQLTAYLNSANLLSPSQYAYKQGHSTEDAVLGAVERLTLNIDRGLISSVTTYDLSKAFDSVDHDVLLSKMAWYGINTAWFRSYLSGRAQVVRGGQLILPMSCGVPQGSIIGPILFILFTNDMSGHLTHGHLISYADDTVHLDCAPPNTTGLDALKNRLELTLLELQAWFGANSLKINEKKTDFLLVGSKHNLKKATGFHFKVDDTIIKPSKKLKILGVVLEPGLSWEAHVSSVVSKCNGILISLYKFRHFFSREVLKIIVQAYVFPYIHYCLCVWGGAAKGQLYKIQKVINFAARVTTGSKKHLHISPALDSLGWPRIETMVTRRDLMKVFKALKQEGVPVNIRALFTPRTAVSTRETRASDRGSLQLRKCRLSATQSVFSYRAAAAWNGLPPDISGVTTLGTFKSAICDL